MKAQFLVKSFTLGCLIGMAAVGGGCSKDEAPTAISLDTAEATVTSAFSAAAPEVQQAAQKIAASAASGDYANSYLGLQALSSNPDLTPEQRMALAQTQMGVMQELNAAAERGDERAAQVLETHRARK